MSRLSWENSMMTYWCHSFCCCQLFDGELNIEILQFYVGLCLL